MSGAMALQVAREETSPDASFFVHRDLQRVIQEEREWRFKLWSQGMLPATDTIAFSLPRPMQPPPLPSCILIWLLQHESCTIHSGEPCMGVLLAH